MPDLNQPRLPVTGAAGQLGRRVVEALLKTTRATEVAGMVRTGEPAADRRAGRLREQGVLTRPRDYDDPGRSCFVAVSIRRRRTNAVHLLQRHRRPAADQLRSERGLALLSAIQRAHDIDGRRVVQDQVLTGLAGSIGQTRRPMHRYDLHGFPPFLVQTAETYVQLAHERLYGQPAAFLATLRAGRDA